jgi:hypothetical protein
MSQETRKRTLPDRPVLSSLSQKKRSPGLNLAVGAAVAAAIIAAIIFFW